MSVPSVESSDGHPPTIVVGLKSLERVIAVTVFNFRIHAQSDIVVCTCTYVLFLFRIFLLKKLSFLNTVHVQASFQQTLIKLIFITIGF